MLVFNEQTPPPLNAINISVRVLKSTAERTEILIEGGLLSANNNSQIPITLSICRPLILQT